MGSRYLPKCVLIKITVRHKTCFKSEEIGVYISILRLLITSIGYSPGVSQSKLISREHFETSYHNYS